MTPYDDPPSQNGHPHNEDDGDNFRARRFHDDDLTPANAPIPHHESAPQSAALPLSSEQVEQLRTLLALGVTRSLAAFYLGIPELDLTKAVEQSAELRMLLAQAQATAEIGPLQQLEAAGASNWRAAAWKLERTRPSRYGRRKPDVFAAAQVGHLLRRLIDIVFTHVVEPERRARIEADIRRLADTMRAWGTEEAR